MGSPDTQNQVLTLFNELAEYLSGRQDAVKDRFPPEHRVLGIGRQVTMFSQEVGVFIQAFPDEERTGPDYGSSEWLQVNFVTGNQLAWNAITNYWVFGNEIAEVESSPLDTVGTIPIIGLAHSLEGIRLVRGTPDKKVNVHVPVLLKEAEFVDTFARNEANRVYSYYPLGNPVGGLQEIELAQY